MMSRYLTRTKLKNAFVFLRTHGLKLFVKTALRDVLQRPWLFSTGRYEAWIRRNEPDRRILQQQEAAKFRLSPRISIIVPVYNTPPAFFSDMLDSVIGQTYANWELCIADGGSTAGGLREMLFSRAKADPRIKIALLQENKGIAGNSNEALSLATGDYLALLDHDDTLSPFALYEIVRAINEDPEADLIYSDEDLISEDGRIRFEPHFKPDWSPDLLRSCNYITHLTVISRGLLTGIGAFRQGFEGSQDYDLILRATEAAGRIVHIPKVLYHWRLHQGSSAGKSDVKPYAFESGKKALAEHITRLGAQGTVEHGDLPGLYKITFLADRPSVSIIIPNRDHAADLRACVRSILDKTTYENYEILIMENGSREPATLEAYEELQAVDNLRILRWEQPFNYSAVNNFAVSRAEGSVLLFLNNDTEVISGDWINRMLEHAVRNEVGIVGAKLYYRDDTIQHAGVVIGSDGAVLHSHRYFPRASFGYRFRLRIIHNVSAVTGACLMVRRTVFEEVGGFDEDFAVTFGDIDLCMKVREKGRVIVWTPYAELYHDELKTRGSDAIPANKARFLLEQRRFMEKWGGIIAKGDPCYSPNLVQDREDFLIRL